MRTKLTTIIIISFFALFSVCTVSCTNPKGVISPDQSVIVNPVLSDVGTLSFDVILNGDTVVKKSPLGILFEGEGVDFTQSLQQTGFEQKVIDDKYTMMVGKQTQRLNHCVQAVYSFRNEAGNKLDIIFRVFDNAVAFCYQAYNNEATSVVQELSAFNFVTIANTWTIPYSSGDERFFTKMQPGTELEESSLSFPVLVETNTNNWALVTESNVSNYPLSSGKFTGTKLEYVFSLPKIAENTVEPDFQSPWRVMMLGGSLADIVENGVVDHLADASKIEDVSWIEPGATSFPWWGNNLANSYPDTLKMYYDLSAAMGWRYVEFDLPLIGSPGRAVENWKTTDWIKNVVDYGLERGVLTFGWDELKNLNTPEKRKEIFGKYNEYGIRGIKVDFVNSYTQHTRKILEELIEDAAEYKLMLSFHGAQSPRGWARTYPHIMTFEAVKGAEYYLSINGAQGMKATHNCTLPFTRNVLGSMDYTPVAFSTNLRETTMAHELALSVIFESGWQGICDVPEAYLNSVARTFLTNLPVAWDETRFLGGYPGEYCCIARRKGNQWYVVGINAGDARTVTLSLPFSRAEKVQVYTDLSEGLNDLGLVEKNLIENEPFEIDMERNGGFAFMVEK